MDINLIGVASFSEYAELADFPLVGENSRTYIALDSNITYHWSGSAYVPVVVGSGATWGGITGTLGDQTDLVNEFGLKVDKVAGERLINAAEIEILSNTSNTNSGNETAATIGAITNAATDYPTPLDADKIGIWETAAGLFKSLTIANLKALFESRINVAVTVELIDALTVTFVNDYALKIDTVTNIKNAPTTTILDDGAAYTVGGNVTIASGSVITVTVNTAAVVNLNTIRI